MGIGVGVGLGSACLFVVAGIIWYFRRRAQRSGCGGSADMVPAGAPVAGPQRLASNEVYELPAKAPSRYPAEVSAENEWYELPS